jgi:hypothetical protein
MQAETAEAVKEAMVLIDVTMMVLQVVLVLLPAAAAALAALMGMEETVPMAFNLFGLD